MRSVAWRVTWSAAPGMLSSASVRRRLRTSTPAPHEAWVEDVG
jgi:hypothetical protein